jgi:flagellar basal body-associated protein FliL
MNNNESSSTGIIIGILVIVIIAIVAWVAYTQGFFKGKEDTKETPGLQINLGGSSSDTEQK